MEGARMEEGQLPGRPFTALTVSKPVYSSGFTDLARQPYASVTPGQTSVVEASLTYLIRLNLDKFQGIRGYGRIRPVAAASRESRIANELTMGSPLSLWCWKFLGRVVRKHL